MGANSKTFLSAYYNDKGQRRDITNKYVSKALKVAATALDYPTVKGIPVNRINTHSLRSGGANALSLAGYSDTHRSKRWANGGGLLSKNISPKSLHVFAQEC
jgi:hypothetical protein